MKMLKKAMAVALSLVLCASLVAPSFAAVELNKDEHIDRETGSLLKNSEDNYDYYLGSDVKLDKTLLIGVGVTASIDLNGHTLAGSGNGSVIRVDGNGITHEGSSLTVTDSSALDEETGKYVTGAGTGTITGGVASYEGGGVVVGACSSFTMNGGQISGNQAGHGGGGISVGGGATVELNHVTITENGAKTNAANGEGGGIFINHSGSTVTINDSRIDNNGGDGILKGGGIYINNESTLELKNSTVNGNSTKYQTFNTDAGGGIYVAGGTVKISNSEIDGNTSGKGGAIFVYGSFKSQVEVTDSKITNNTARGGSSVNQPSAIYAADKENITVTVSNSVIAGNETSGTVAGAVAGKVDLSKCTVCGNKTGGEVAGDSVHDASIGWEVTVQDATCEEAGVRTYTCKYCGDTKTETIEKLGHTPADAVRENEKPATCTAEGSYDEVVRCSECGELLSSTPKTTEKLDHTPADAVYENEVAAQIGVAGSYDEVVKCSVCDEVLSRETVAIPALAAPAAPGGLTVTPDVPAEDPTIEIDEPDVPLAGLPIDLEAEDKLTRGQFIGILHWMDNEPAAELSTFLDVLADSDYAEAIGWAQANGIALGVGGSRFAPDEYVTRGQLIAFLNRYAQYVGSDLVLEVEGDPNETLTWAVAEEIINDFFDRL